MCGICLIVTGGYNSRVDCCSNAKVLAELEDALKRRGPDKYSSISLHIEDDCTIHLNGSVLWTQGCNITTQPLVDASGRVLLWNGDVFGGEMARYSSESDTEILSSELSCNSFLHVMSAVRGPFSIVYWDPVAKCVWFGRDRLGRHSLLLWCSPQQNQILAITSVASKMLQCITEVPAIGLYSAVYNDGGLSSVCLYPWSDVTEDQLLSFKEEFVIKCCVSQERLPSPLSLSTCTSVTVGEPPEGELLALTLASTGLAPVQVMERLLHDCSLAARVNQFISVLNKAVSVRVSTQPSVCQLCATKAITCDSSEVLLKGPDNCRHAKTAVLFSGGLDSAVLARLAHDFVPTSDPIDLLNVAFEKQRPPVESQCRKQRRKGEQENEVAFDVPDRRTGRDTLQELKKCFPLRQWNFVEINVGIKELNAERDKRICHLLYPLVSVLDDSLGCALWFASRGKGLLEQPDGQFVNYTSPARVLLLGMGADEQLGGYMRHRTVLRRCGWPGLTAELQLDLSRISARNLGRDDRITADHGRQARYPYLDEDVISFLAALPPWQRCCPVQLLPPGFGDKMLLRLAALKLGINKATFFPKRAFQFGSRIANSKEKATDVSHRL